MDVLQSREAVEDCLELFGECLCGELDFSSVEAFIASVKLAERVVVVRTSYSTDLESRSNLSWQSPLCSRQDDVDKLLGCRNWRYLFPCRLHLAHQILVDARGAQDDTVLCMQNEDAIKEISLSPREEILAFLSRIWGRKTVPRTVQLKRHYAGHITPESTCGINHIQISRGGNQSVLQVATWSCEGTELDLSSTAF